MWGASDPDDNSTRGMGYPIAEARLVTSKWTDAGWRNVRNEDEAIANANLIAAAPDLLAALKCFVADERFIVGVGGNPNVVEKMIEAARAAIAKAEGKAP